MIFGGAFLWLKKSRVQWAKNQLPEVERLREEAALAWDYAKYREALGLAQQASQYVPDDPGLRKAIDTVSRVVPLQSDPIRLRQRCGSNHTTPRMQTGHYLDRRR